MKTTLTIVALIASFAWTGIASAQGRPSQLASHLPDERGLTLDLDVGWDSDRIEGSTVQVFAPTFGVSLALSRKLELELHWPLVFLDRYGAINDSTFLSGNPFAAAYLVKRDDEGYFRIGAGVALPISNIDEDSGRLFGIGKGAHLDTLAYDYARAMRGMWDAWLYYPDQFAFVIPAQLEGQHGALVLGADAAAALLVPVDQTVDKNTDVVLQAAGMLGLRAGVVTAGLRVQGVWSPTSDGNAQIAGVPFIQGDFSGGSFVYGRFVLNLDEPLGIFKNGADLWGVFVGAGARL